MEVEVIIVSILCFILFIKPFHYFLHLFHHREQSLTYKSAHLVALLVVTVFILVMMEDLSASALAMFLLSPFLMVETLFITSLFLFARDFFQLRKECRGVLTLFLLSGAVFSVMKLWQDSSQLFKHWGGGPDDPTSTMYQMSWVNPFTSELIVNIYLFIFLSCIAILCSLMISGDDEAVS